MNASEIMAELFAPAEEGFDYSKTCDTCKSGDPLREVRRVGVAMFATPAVIRRAADWGADLLIVHEPTYYNHMDVHSDDKIECAKRALIEESGMVLWRFHDHAHRLPVDLIADGVLRALAPDAEIDFSRRLPGDARVTFRRPITPRELARQIEQNLGVAHVRVCGAADTPCTRLAAMVGAPGRVVFDELRDGACEMVLTGETTEWAYAEYARDAAELGYTKALLILGHIGSERAGMVLCADQLRERHPELAVSYFEGGEVYTYTDR